MKILKNKEFLSQIIRYTYISIWGYAFVFVSLYLMVQVLKINESVSFMIVYGISYLILYSLQLKYLFKTKHDNSKLFRFCFSLLFFYALANLIYNICIHYQVNYLISTSLTIIILFPLRFIISKYFVYK